MKSRLPPKFKNVVIKASEYDDIWLRDTGCTFLRKSTEEGGVGGSKLVAVRWTFNCWGNKHHSYERDCTVSGQVASLANGDGATEIICSTVLEGGSFHTDGKGTIITTEECLLHPNRASSG